MKVKELIKQLLDEDSEADVFIYASGVAVDVAGISSNYHASKVVNLSSGGVCLEPETPVQWW